MKVLKVAIVTNKLEYHRFTSKIISCDVIIEHENPFTYLKLFSLNPNSCIILGVGDVKIACGFSSLQEISKTNIRSVNNFFNDLYLLF